MLPAIFSSLIVFIIVFSCLFYGSVTIFPQTIIATVAGFMVLAWLVNMAYKKELSFVKVSFFMPIALFLGLIFIQLVPLPLSFIRLISANTAYIYENFIPSGPLLSGYFPLSIYPNATISELLKVLTYFAIFFLVINNTKTRKQFDLIINAVIFFGLLISIFAIIQKYTYSGKVYWFDPAGSAPTPFGTFVNRNNFAGYINMIIPLALGYFLVDMPMSRRAIYALSVGVMSLALFLSLSRAGVLVYIIVLLSFLLFSRLKDTTKARGPVLAALLITVSLFFILLMDAKAFWPRLISIFHKDTFITLGHGYSWVDIFRIWLDFPLLGTGLGTFGNISAMYKTTSGESLFIYAHNDFLQMICETGLLGFVLLSIFFVLYFRSIIKLWLKRHDPYAVCLLLGAIASLWSMFVYSLLDFNLHIPANAILFFIIMGLAYRLAHTRFNDEVSG